MAKPIALGREQGVCVRVGEGLVSRDQVIMGSWSTVVDQIWNSRPGDTTLPVGTCRRYRRKMDKSLLF
jgi:hypothetical protein